MLRRQYRRNDRRGRSGERGIGGGRFRRRGSVGDVSLRVRMDGEAEGKAYV